MTHRALHPHLGPSLAILSSLAVMLGACVASAQATSARATSAQATSAQATSARAPRGLALEAVLAETGLSLDAIVVPSDPRGAVRLELRDAQSLAIVLDVRVLASAREAEDRLSSVEPSLSSAGVADVALGDRAVGDDAGSVLALARGNVLVVVRAVPREPASLDVRAVAAAVVRACDQSPTLGREGASPALPPSSVPALENGAASIALPRGFVAMRVDVEGEGLARRGEGDSWVVERARRREDVRVVAVDALLRVAR